MESRELCIVIMAGGQGKRMQSTLPKVLHPIANVPMLINIIRTAKQLHPKKIILIINKHRNIFDAFLERYGVNDNIDIVIQETAQGTGHAVACATETLKPHPDTKTLILSGDVPLISHNVLQTLIEQKTDNGILTTYLENPHGYGRIICDMKNMTSSIKETFCIHRSKMSICEEKDCTDKQRTVQTVNAGVYVFNTAQLCDCIKELNNNNAQQEYYLPDVLPIILDKYENSVSICNIPTDKQYQIMGVNTPTQLEALENTLYSERKYTFIHPTKNGGTACETFFHQLYPEYISGRGHDNLCTNDNNPIIIVRDPLSRFVSMYNYWKHGSQDMQDYQRTNDFIERHKDVSIMEFTDFVRTNDPRLTNNFTWDEHFLPQTHWLNHAQYYNIIVIRYTDDLDDKIQRLLKYLHIPSKNLGLPKLNVTIKTDVTIDPKVMSFVEEYYNSDYELIHTIENRPQHFRFVL